MKAFWSATRLSFRAIGRSKLRAALTVLGILIGVAAVVIVVGLGSGVRQLVIGRISQLGSNVIFIDPQTTQTSGAKRRELGRLTEGDAKAILAEATSVAAVTPFSSTTMQVVAGEKNAATQVMGVGRSYFEIRAFAIEKGSVWSAADENVKAKVCVLGATVRENLFGTGEAIGQYVRIGRHAFRVVGVLAKKGSMFGDDQDDRLIMPVGSFRARIMPTAPGRVHKLIASATDERTVERAVRQIDQILRQRHQIEPEHEPDFEIGTQAEFRKSQDATFSALTALLSSIAAVSLLVGGIGVMNIMLVSVTERTREIGIRMAIGAREADILVQFLVEAVVLCLLGGVAGLGLGIGLLRAISVALGWEMILPPSAVVLAFATSATIGVVFGFLPARRAARLDPIRALRHE